MRLEIALLVPILLALSCGGPGTGQDGTGQDGTGQNGDVEIHDSENDLQPTDPDAGQQCTRAESIAAVTVLRPEPFDVIIVADNSGSISWSRDSLSAGLQNLLSLVHGQDVRFFLLSPTQYGASSQEARDRVGHYLVTYEDEATGMAHTNAVTEYAQTCTDQSGEPADCAERFQSGNGYSVRGSWSFELPEPIAAITPDMDGTAIEEQQQKIADAILAQGTGGAQLEQPICTLSRYITQDPELLPEHAVFVVIADEDDTSDPADCLASYTYDAEQIGAFDGKCEKDCDYYSYTMSSEHVLQTISATCTRVDDQGQPRPETATTLSVSSTSKLCVEDKTECDDEDLATLSASCGEGNIITDCEPSCGNSSTILRCELQRASSDIDLCSEAFSEAGVSYESMSEYCETTAPDEGPWMDCTSQGYSEDSIPAFAGPEELTQVIEAATIEEQMTEFHQRANSAFGEGGYFVESIVFAPQFSCELQSGQSYGTHLSELATSPEDVFPICGDYAPALQRIESFAQRLVENEFGLRLASDESILKVSIQSRSGEPRPLSESDYEFDREGELLTVAEGLLQPSDVGIAVTVEDSCIEVVR